MTVSPATAALALELQRRRGIRGSLLSWSKEALARLGQTPARHHLMLIEALEWLSQTDDGRLMIFAPPGSAKTRYASELFAAWYLAQAPGLSVIGASHTSTFAEDISRRVMSLVREHGLALGFNIGARESAELWDTSHGSRYRSVGIGGGITGTRCDLAIIDDPVRGRADAESETARNVAWNWFRNDLLTRMNPKGKIVIIMTRWHLDDLGGRLLEAEPGKWRILNLPALAEADDPLGREIGEALWPEREDVAQLGAKRATMGDRDFVALFQQRPVALTGGLFEVDRLNYVDSYASGGRSIRAWDLAATKSSTSDYTCGVRMNRDQDGRVTVEDVIRIRADPSGVEAAILAAARQDGTQVHIGLPQDPGAAGKMVLLYLIRQLGGWTVKASPESGDKTLRAGPFASQINSGNVSLVRGAWNAAYVSELRSFPSGVHDDAADASSRAFGELATRPVIPVRFVSVGFGSTPPGVERYADGRRPGIDRCRIGEQHGEAVPVRTLNDFMDRS